MDIVPGKELLAIRYFCDGLPGRQFGPELASLTPKRLGPAPSYLDDPKEAAYTNRRLLASPKL